MKKNVAGQKVGIQMITAADGTLFAGTVTAYVTGDAGTQAIGTVGSGVCAHEGNGYHTYSPSQAETNYDLTAFTFIGTLAIPATLQAYNSFPQAVDNNVLAAGPTGFAAIDTVVDSILVDTGTTIPGIITTIDTNVDAILVDTGTTIPATITTAQNDLDIITGASGVNLLTATQASIDAIEVDTGTTIPATLATVDSNVDAILVDTGTTLPASIATVDSNVDAILVDTATTIPDQLDDMSGATFATATDSLEALRNRGDAAWTTGAGGSSPTVAEIRTEMDDNSTKLAAIVADTNELQADDIPGRFDGLEGATFDTATDSNEAIRNRGDAAWAGGGSAPTVSQIRTEMDDNSTKLAAIVADTNELQADDVPGLIATLQADTDDIQTRLPASLAGGLMSSDAVAISGSTAAAVQLEASAETIVIAAAVTGTLSTTQMTSDLTEATDDHYNGRIIIWTSGALKDQATNITDYTGTNGLLTFTAITEAPSNADTFVIV